MFTAAITEDDTLFVDLHPHAGDNFVPPGNCPQQSCNRMSCTAKKVNMLSLNIYRRREVQASWSQINKEINCSEKKCLVRSPLPPAERAITAWNNAWRRPWEKRADDADQRAGTTSLSQFSTWLNRNGDWMHETVRPRRYLLEASSHPSWRRQSSTYNF
jgi:hypothetical protein